jgi:hypothetical protein
MSTPHPPKADDVHFLTEEFGIPPFKAARLVTGRTELADELMVAELKRQHEADPLADVPTPQAPRSEYIVEPGEDQLKPIVGQHNLRGAG